MSEENLDVRLEARLTAQAVVEPPTSFVGQANVADEALDDEFETNRSDACKRAAGGV